MFYNRAIVALSIANKVVKVQPHEFVCSLYPVSGCYDTEGQNICLGIQTENLDTLTYSEFDSQKTGKQCKHLDD